MESGEVNGMMDLNGGGSQVHFFKLTILTLNLKKGRESDQAMYCCSHVRN